MNTASFPHRIILPTRQPVVRETKYLRITSALSATAIALVLTCGILITVWFVSRTSQDRATIHGWRHPPQHIGTIRETNSVLPTGPVVQSPDTEQPVASFLSDNVVQTILIHAATAAAAPEPVSATPTDGKGVVETGMSFHDVSLRPKRDHAQKWQFEVAAPADLTDYVTMLQQLQIELGMMSANGRITYLAPADNGSQIRNSENASDDPRFGAVWNEGQLHMLDEQLYRLAGVNADGSRIVHFFAPQLEQRLRTLETEFSAVPAELVRRTTFRITKTDGLWSVHVTQQDTVADDAQRR